MTTPALTPDMLLRGYAAGIFPMADSRDAPDLHWIDPQRRGVIPLDGFRLSRSLRRRIRADPFAVGFDTDFAGVIEGCANRPETWINETIVDLYTALAAAGHAHSVEIRQDGALVGGVYGVAIGGAFFGESMFSRRTDASKIALAYLIDRLRTGGFTLFDTQFLTPHLATLGAIEVSRVRFRHDLARALRTDAGFGRAGPGTPSALQVLQRMTQTS